MKIGFVFGKGIDGCGVTRGALIFEKWLIANGHECVILNFDNGQTFSRAKFVDFIGDVHTVGLTDENIDYETIKLMNACDIVICHSYPTRKQQSYVDRFRVFVEQIKDPIIVMHDHAIVKININAVPQSCELFSMADVVVVQSKHGFSQSGFREFDNGISDRIVENPIWFNTKSLDQYDKSFNERIKRRKHLMYIGRMSVLKDPGYICRIQPFLKDWDLSLVGCERSIGSVTKTKQLWNCPAPYIPEFKQNIQFFTSISNNRFSVKGEDSAPIKAWDLYSYTDGMTKLGSSFASWCGYRLNDAAEYGSRMEYTMVESYLLSLPIINRQFAETAKSPDGKLWGDYSGALISEAGEEQECAEVLKSMQQQEWTDRHVACKEQILKFNEIDCIGQEYLDNILKLGKRKSYVNAIDEITRFFPNAQELRGTGKVIMSNHSSVLNKKPMILEDGKQHIVKPEITKIMNW